MSSQASSSSSFSPNNAPTPIPLLLPELLSEIFEHACLASSNKFIHTTATPLALSRVCSLWHTTALATPRLWSTIALTSRHWSDQENNLALLHKYLRHSGAMPLDIYIEFDASDPYYPSALNDPTPFVDAISRRCERWRNLTLKLPVDAMARFTATLGKLNAPELVSLRLQETLCSNPSSPIDPPSQQTFLLPWDIPAKDARQPSPFPSLRSLALSWVATSETFSILPIEQITDLSLIPHYNHTNQLTPPDAVTLLAKFEALSKLSLSISELHHTPTNLVQVTQLLQSVTLKKLSSVVISGHPVAVSDLWSMFHQLPKLARVQATYPANDPEEEGFKGLLERSGRMLKADDDDDFGDYGWEDGGIMEIVEKC
jgi:hypothetical protein